MARWRPSTLYASNKHGYTSFMSAHRRTPAKRLPARTLVVDTEEAGRRVDNYLLARLKGVPRSHVYRILRRGEVRVNRGRVKAHVRLHAGDEIRLPPLEEPALPARRAPARVYPEIEALIVYESGDLLAVNKPAGLAVHGGSGISAGLIERLRASHPGTARLELVHRLDRETSGCVIIAKRRSVLRRLHEALRSRNVEKRYISLVRGLWTEREKVELPLRRDIRRGGERIVEVDRREGLPSATCFHPLSRCTVEGWELTLVEARLITGRTHQIRVHSAARDHPIAGDEKYGDRQLNKALRRHGLSRMYLHAVEARLPPEVLGHPLRLHAPLPPVLETLNRRLGL